MDWYSTIARKGVERHGECLLWKGMIITGGYGSIRRKQPNGKIVARAAHRVAYEGWKGAIPDGMIVDHVCHNVAAHAGLCAGRWCLHRRCINPAHLEAKTQPDNIRASPLPRQVKTECIHGHAYDTKNTGIDKRGIKWCKQCKKTRDAARWRRMRHDGHDDSAGGPAAS